MYNLINLSPQKIEKKKRDGKKDFRKREKCKTWNRGERQIERERKEERGREKIL